MRAALGGLVTATVILGGCLAEDPERAWRHRAMAVYDIRIPQSARPGERVVLNLSGSDPVGTYCGRFDSLHTQWHGDTVIVTAHGRERRGVCTDDSLDWSDSVTITARASDVTVITRAPTGEVRTNVLISKP